MSANFWLPLVSAMFLPAACWAQSCTFGVSGLNFGTVDTLSTLPTDVTGTLTVNCSGSSLSRILICPSIGTGSGGTSATPRQMASGANKLDYQIYSDSGRSVVWGSSVWSFSPRPPALALTLNLGGTGSGSTTIYGRVPSGQGSSPPASYLSAFNGSHTEFRYRYVAIGGNCNTTNAADRVSRPTFNVNATVAANCLVATQNIDFGTKGILSGDVDATGQVSVTCTPGTAYTVGLGNGMTGTGPTARRMTLGAQFVTYGLYRDSNRSQPWGTAVGTTVAGTGNGASQPIQVYGRVPSQTTPTPGVYTDTVVVTVTY